MIQCLIAGLSVAFLFVDAAPVNSNSPNRSQTGPPIHSLPPSKSSTHLEAIRAGKRPRLITNGQGATLHDHLHHSPIETSQGTSFATFSLGSHHPPTKLGPKFKKDNAPPEVLRQRGYMREYMRTYRRKKQLQQESKAKQAVLASQVDELQDSKKKAGRPLLKDSPSQELAQRRESQRMLKANNRARLKEVASMVGKSVRRGGVWHGEETGSHQDGIVEKSSPAHLLDQWRLPQEHQKGKTDKPPPANLINQWRLLQQVASLPPDHHHHVKVNPFSSPRGGASVGLRMEGQGGGRLAHQRDPINRDPPFHQKDQSRLERQELPDLNAPTALESEHRQTIVRPELDLNLSPARDESQSR